MQVILVMVTSLDGKTTRGAHPPNLWASKEDQAFLHSVIDGHNLFIMGSRTFLSARRSMKLSPDKLRVVITRAPHEYQEHSVAGQLEFTNQSLPSLLDRLRSEGYERALLLSGETLTTMFFKNRLIDEIWITVEPKLFGSGKSILSDEELHVDLELKSIKILSDYLRLA